MTSPFSWRKGAEESPSDAFIKSLPPSPLRANLGALHALFLVSQAREVERMLGTEDTSAAALELFEHQLRQIATYTQLSKYEARTIVGSQQDTPRVRREFRKKEKR